METQTKTKKTADRKEYMRAYMLNYYKKHKEVENTKCLGRYYKKNRKIPQEDLEIFKEHIAIITKTRECLDKIKQECPQFLEYILEYSKKEIPEIQEFQEKPNV